MQEDFDFRKIWGQQQSTPPDINELKIKLQRYRKNAVLKLVLGNLALLATCCFIVFIWVRFQPEYITTKIGMVLVIVAMAIFMVAQNKLIPLFKTLNADESNSTYIQNLIHLKERQKQIQTTMLSVYFIMLSLGLSLYLFEYTERMSTVWQIITYTASLGWIAFNWFVARPKAIKKQQQKIDELIEQSKVINEHLRAG